MKKERLILIGIFFSAVLVAFSLTLIFIPLVVRLVMN